MTQIPGRADEEALARELDTVVDGAHGRPASGSTELDAPLEALAKLRSALKATPASAPPEIPGFVLRGEVGRGGMGVVVRAFDAALQREVAVKFLADELAQNAVAKERFLAEARALAKLRHPNLLAVHAAGEAGGKPYFAMELVDGTALDKAVAQCRAGDGGVLPSNAKDRCRTVARLFAEAAEALATVHRAGLLHRDVKPANLLIAKDGTVRLADFGIALDQRRHQDAFDAGTLRYISPERLDGMEGPAGDVYALGISMLEALTLEPAFSQKTPADLKVAIGSGVRAGASVKTLGLDARLVAIARRACARNAADRFADAAEMARSLREYLHRRWWQQPAVVAAAAAALAALLVGAGYVGGLFRGDRPQPDPNNIIPGGPNAGQGGPPPFGPRVRGNPRGPREEFGPPPGPNGLRGLRGEGPMADVRNLRDLARNGRGDEFDRAARPYENHPDGPPEHRLIVALIAHLRGDDARAAGMLDALDPEDLPPPFRQEFMNLRNDVGGPRPPGPGNK